MTEYELHELQMLRWEQVSTTYGLLLTVVTIYLTVTFAYLAAAHFTGRDLSRFQAAILSSVFCVSALFTTYQIVALLVGMNFWGEQLVQGYSFMSESLERPELATLAKGISEESTSLWEEGLIALIGILGTVFSLLFMWSVRHPKLE